MKGLKNFCTFFAGFFKENPTALFFSFFSLLFIVLVLIPFFHNNKSLLKNIPDNLAWAQTLDSDGDGISDNLERESDPNRDTDGDGIKDFLDQDTCTMPSFTGMGPISLQLWLYECNSNCELIEDQDIIYFIGCRAEGAEEIDLPSSYGDFPYGLWNLQVKLTQEFKHYGDYEKGDFETYHKIFLEVFFPGLTKPLSSEYWAKQYDKDKNRVVWDEYSQDLFFPNVDKYSITIQLSDSRRIKPDFLDIEPGYGDSNEIEWIIDHEGGLLWPIEVGGRCFIDHLLLKKPH